MRFLGGCLLHLKMPNATSLPSFKYHLNTQLFQSAVELSTFFIPLLYCHWFLCQILERGAVLCMASVKDQAHQWHYTNERKQMGNRGRKVGYEPVCKVVARNGRLCGLGNAQMLCWQSIFSICRMTDVGQRTTDL